MSATCRRSRDPPRRVPASSATRSSDVVVAVTRLSRTRTSWPASSSVSTVWDPRYPAPPVTRTRMSRSYPGPVTSRGGPLRAGRGHNGSGDLHPPDLRAAPRGPRGVRGRRARRPPALPLRGAGPPDLGPSRLGDGAALRPGGRGASARPRRASVPARGRRGLPSALAPADHQRGGLRGPAQRDQRVPRRADGAHPVRDRGGRVGRRRQVDDGARAPGDAAPLADHTARRAGHHGRLPAPQRGAARARHHVPQGLPRVLRPPRAAALHGGRQVRGAGGARARVLAHHLRHRAGRGTGGAPSRRADRGGTQRAGPAAHPGRRHRRALRLRLLRLLGVRGRARVLDPVLVHRPVHGSALGGLRRPAQLLPPVLLPVGRRGSGDGRVHLGLHQRPEPRAERAPDPRARPAGAHEERATRGDPRAAEEGLIHASHPPSRRAGRARAARGRLRHARRGPVPGDAGFRLRERGRVVPRRLEHGAVVEHARRPGRPRRRREQDPPRGSARLGALGSGGRARQRAVPAGGGRDGGR
ncbi:putative Uncharacterized 50.6 kDa protein in the 5'region of gyrA and gyrB [Micrococcus luteus]|nr:putative Uncharacterized 50.6 kDa protein in the 5'region of gyrA and gyrB [Micrococcus luteus]